MAVTISPAVNPNAVNMRTFDVTASVDADTTADIAHGITGIGDPNKELTVTIEPLNAAAYTAQWVVTSRDQLADKTTVRLTKGTGVGSGNAAAQIRVHVQRMHSLVE